MMFRDMKRTVRSFNRTLQGGLHSAYLCRGIAGTMNHERAIRVIRARVRKGTLEMRALNTGRWITVDTGNDYYYLA